MPGERRGREKSVSLFRCAIIALLVVVLDQIAKHLVQNAIQAGSSVPVIRNILHITLVLNKGAAFGMLNTHNTLFIVVGAFFLILTLFYLPKIDPRNRLIMTALASISGGVAGNLIDRIRFGYVVDFIDIRVWPVFNIADSAITVGAAIICIILLRRKHASDTF